MPELVQLYREAHDEGVRVIALSLDLPRPVSRDTPEAVCAFVAEQGFELPVRMLPADASLERLADALGLDVLGTPQTLVWNAAGEKVAHHVGSTDLAGFRRLVERATDGT